MISLEDKEGICTGCLCVSREIHTVGISKNVTYKRQMKGESGQSYLARLEILASRLFE